MQRPIKGTRKSKGLGDSIAKITKAIGIEPCKGCEKRQAILNALIPYNGTTLTDEETTFVKESTLTKESHKNRLWTLYTRTHENITTKPSNCTECWDDIRNSLLKLTQDDIL